MGALTEPAFDALVAAGCGGCGGKSLLFQTFLDARVPLMGGDVVGNLVFVHDGEKFIDGVYAVACASCQTTLFESGVCPRCNAAGGLAKALATPNAFPVPTQCSSCGGEEVRFIALAPAKASFSGGRAEKPKTASELGDDGFHGVRIDCSDCGTVAEKSDRCPLCGAAGPLRPRP